MVRLPRTLSFAARMLPAAAGEQPVYVCVVHNPGVSLTPVSYLLHIGWEFNQTTLNEKERQVAQQLFDRWEGWLFGPWAGWC